MRRLFFHQHSSILHRFFRSRIRGSVHLGDSLMSLGYRLRNQEK